MINEERQLQQGSPGRFGYEWSVYSEILPESREQLQRWLGSVALESFAGKTVLDVGCGMGRNPYWMAKSGAKQVTAVDVDEGSLGSARKNLGSLANATVKKCSAYDLDPAALGTFDRVTCIGVLHHLDNPELALKKMWSCVKPGGELILWCYGKEGNRFLLPAIQGLRFVGSKLPIAVTHRLAGALTLVAWPAFKMLPFKTDYYRYIKRLSYKNLESIIFDQILPKISNYWTHEDMARLLAPLSKEVRLEFVQGNSWSARAVKPLS